MENRHAGPAHWISVVASGLGGIVLASLWAGWLTYASNMSAGGSTNDSSVRFLVVLVAAQAVAVTIYLVLLVFWRYWRLRFLTFLPALVWGLILLNTALLFRSFYF